MLHKSSTYHLCEGNNSSFYQCLDHSGLCTASTEHLKMMRLLSLCLLLLLPAATAVSEEGSGDLESDDEDMFVAKVNNNLRKEPVGSAVDKTTGEEQMTDQTPLIIIIAAVVVLTLSVAVIVTIMLVRRRMHSRQQGIYSVPAEQDHKGAV